MFKPVHRMMTVKLDPISKKTSGGIVLPDNFTGNRVVIGEIRAISKSLLIDPANIFCTGQRVSLIRHTITRRPTVQGGDPVQELVDFVTVDYDGEELALIQPEDVTGVLGYEEPELGKKCVDDVDIN